MYNYSPRAVLLTNSDPFYEPDGGTATFSKHLLTVFPDTFAVSSYSCDDSYKPGQWQSRKFNGREILFFGRGKSVTKKSRKPFFPARLRALILALKHMRNIRTIPIRNVFVDSPELLIAASYFSWDSLCYSFSGVNNPVAISRYPFARIFGTPFERFFIKRLVQSKPDAMIAAADKGSIQEFLTRINHAINVNNLHIFPSRADTNIFYPRESIALRTKLGSPQSEKILVCVGRLSWIKGWNLILESVHRLIVEGFEARIIFVGDGEDKNKIFNRAKELFIENKVLITGFLPQKEVAEYINLADVCLMGSYREGWSLAMCEILCCGKPIVSTNVSGAQDMIRNDQNGFIVTSRNPEDYAHAIRSAFELKNGHEISLRTSRSYGLDTMKDALQAIWRPLQG